MERPSPAVQDYLKAIYRLSEESSGGPVATGELAEALGVSTPSASNMLKRLDGLGYVRQERGRGGRLTESGRAAALEVVRLHRLIETFLASRLGMSWDEVHREAEILEHHVSLELAERIADALGHPERDPHGDPIPSAAGVVPQVSGDRLWGLPEGAAGIIARVDDGDPELLRFLGALGLVLDAPVEVVGRGAFGGPLSVRVAGGPPVEVPPDAARAVVVGPRDQSA